MIRKKRKREKKRKERCGKYGKIIWVDNERNIGSNNRSE